MSATYEPGTVAVATVRGVPNVRVTARAHATRADRVVWMVPGDHAADEQEVTDVRPLVVLDLTEYERTHCPAFGDEVVPYLLRTLRTPSIPADAVREWLADQIEAQTRPPKPAEPTGLGAVVEDAEGGWWVHCQDAESWHWYRGGKAKQYDAVDAVRVLSEGIQ